MSHVILLGPYPPPYGGISIFNYTLFHYFNNRGMRAWAYGHANSKPNGVSEFLPKVSILATLLCKEGRRATFLDSLGYFLEYPSLKLVLTWIILKPFLKFHWIKVLHSGTLPSRFPRFSFLEKCAAILTVRFADEFIVVHNDLKVWLETTFRAKQKIWHICSLLPEYDSSDDCHLPKEVRQARASCKKLICSIGAFSPNYGFQIIAEVMEEIREETGESIGLVLIDGAFTREEAYKINTLNQREWITVLQEIPHPVLREILKKCDLFIRSTESESLGLSKIESILCGTPVVCTPVGETRGMQLFEFGNRDQMKVQIKKALFEDEKRVPASLVKTFRQEAENNLDSLESILINQP